MCKKILELRKAIENKNIEKSLSLIDEFYNITRDFSQSIEITVNGDKLILKDHYKNPVSLLKLKKELISWVGGR